MKVQIGMFGDVKKWQKKIEKVSELFDTEDEESLHYILQGACRPHAARIPAVFFEADHWLRQRPATLCKGHACACIPPAVGVCASLKRWRVCGWSLTIPVAMPYTPLLHPEP